MLRRVEAVARGARARHQAARQAACGAAPSTPRPPVCCASTRAPSAWQPDFTILDRGDAEDLMQVARTRLGLARPPRFPQKGTCLDIYTRCVNARSRCRRCCARPFPGACGRGGPGSALRGLRRRQGEQSVLDYDDLLLFWRGLLADPAGGARVRERFDYVLVDEYQDTNALQADILSLLGPDGTGSPSSATMPRPSTPSGPLPCATSSISRSASRAPRSSRSSRTTAAPRPSSTPPTRSSPRPPSGATRSSGPSAGTAAAPCSSPAATRTSRRSGSASASSSTASGARRSSSRRCCSAPSTTAWRWRWS